MIMDTDKELLELAAKAYWGEEIDDVCSIRWLDSDNAIGYTHADNQDHNGLDCEWLWNPRQDDGDALRLGAKIGMNLYISKDYCIAEIISDSEEPAITIKEVCEGDTLNAARRAIVRAAAEVAKATGKVV